MVERVPRIDRLTTSIWSAATTQFQRRGEEWLSKKGGFERLEVSDEMLESIKEGKLTSELTESFLESMTVEKKMLLLNLLGEALLMDIDYVVQLMKWLREKCLTILNVY